MSPCSLFIVIIRIALITVWFVRMRDCNGRGWFEPRRIAQEVEISLCWLFVIFCSSQRHSFLARRLVQKANNSVVRYKD